MRAVYSSLLTRNQYHILEMHSLKLKKKQEKTKEYNQRSAIYSQGSVLLPPGFANKENSCYANSILQCIFNIRALRDLCEKSCGLHPEKCQCRKEGSSIICEILVYKNHRKKVLHCCDTEHSQRV